MNEEIDFPTYVSNVKYCIKYGLIKMDAFSSSSKLSEQQKQLLADAYVTPEQVIDLSEIGYRLKFTYEECTLYLFHLTASIAFSEQEKKRSILNLFRKRTKDDFDYGKIITATAPFIFENNADFNRYCESMSDKLY